MKLNDPDGPDDASSDVAVLDPIEELAEVRLLLVNPDDNDSVCTPAQQKRLSGLVKIAEQLEALTEWSRDELLDNIGCEHPDPSVLAEEEARIARCTDFLAILLEAAQRVDTARSCRAVVRRCARLSKATQDVAGLAKVLHAKVPHGGEVSALDYIELGELSSAERVARIAAGVELPGSAVGPSPYDDDPVVHLSVPRVDLYVRGRRDILGERVFKSMTSHIDGCPACEDAVAVRRSLVHPD